MKGYAEKRRLLRFEKGNVQATDRKRKRQKQRFIGKRYRFNGDIESSDVEKYCLLGEREQKCMEKLYTSLKLSARAYHRILKVARTIADLAGEDGIREEHLLEAACYRPARDYWI